MKHTIAILDKDRRYADKAAGYINNRAGFPFKVIVFSDPEELGYINKAYDIDIKLVDEELLPQTGGYDGGDCIILSGGESRIEDDRRVIYKYQSYENIIKEILLYASSKDELRNIVSRKSVLKLIGMFSPIERSGQTDLGLAVGQNLAKTYRTLYVNMDCYSSLKDRLGLSFEGDLSDMLYAMDNDSGSIATLIGGSSGSLNGLDIMPPMDRHEDLISIDIQDWLRFLRHIENETDYEFVILDMSKAVRGLKDIIIRCGKLIVTTLEDKWEQEKLSVFRKELEEQKELEGNILYVEVPIDQDVKRDPLIYGMSGKLGDIAREIAKEITA